MGDDNSIQHAQMMQVLLGLTGAAGVLLVAFISRWIGGVWIVLLATLAAILFTFQPLIHATLFSNIKNDRLQMILLALIPFTLVLILLSFKRVPMPLRLLFALVGPALLLGWVFHDYAIQTVPRQTLYLHQVGPIALAIFGCWLLIEPLATRSPGVSVPMVITMLATAGTFLLMLSADNNAGLIATPIAGTAGGAAAAAVMAGLFRMKATSLARGPVLLWLTALGSLFALLWISSDQLPLAHLYWLAAIPLLAWIPEIGPIHRLKPWKRESIRFVLIVIPTAAAMALAFKEHQKEAAEAGDPFGVIWPIPQPAAPIVPSQMPMPNTINPPTMT